MACLSGCGVRHGELHHCPPQSALQEPVLGTNCIGKKCCSMGELAKGLPGTLRGTESPDGMQAGGWCQGLLGQGGGCVWWCQAGNTEGFSTEWLLSVAFCCLFLEGAFILSVPSDECLCFTTLWLLHFGGMCSCAFGSHFNKDYWGPSLVVGKVESCQFEAAVPLPLFLLLPFPQIFSSQLYSPSLPRVCPRNEHTNLLWV